ncbi:MAG: LPS export ABC transporter permease LptF [Proteobacteria bacterium]|nr:MAG: LPS export ABC transporter permease LptF [Pseudomonadota bacterium]
MIYLRTTLREFTAAGIAVFLVLLVITFTTQLIRFLGFAARGGIPTDAVLILLGFSALGYLSVLLSLALYGSVLLTLTRVYRDSEMVVWQSSGLGLLDWLRPVLIYATPIVIMVAVLSLYLTPWAIGKSEEYRHQLENRDDVSAVAPGVFKESKNGERVFFVEKVSSDLSRVENIFVHSAQNGRQGVMVAQHGYTELAANGDRFLVMLNGRRYEGTPGQADYRIVRFERYAVRIEQSESKPYFPTEKSLPTRTLLDNPTRLNLSEFTWRIGLPVSALILSLLAIPLSAVNPRTGRLLNVLLAVFLYMIYSNLISIAQAWVASGGVKPLIGMWVVHAAMLMLLVVLLYRRVIGFRFLRFA